MNILGNSYVEEEKRPYHHYHRTVKQRLRRNSNPKLSPLSSSNPVYSSLKRRAKRQLDFDPTAKHVEVLVAYDDSIKEFHSDADIKSYILTLFSYVS